jgi:hypothetical protein
VQHGDFDRTWAVMKDPEAAKEKKRQAMKPIAARRQRDAKGCFLA